MLNTDTTKNDLAGSVAPTATTSVPPATDTLVPAQNDGQVDTPIVVPEVTHAKQAAQLSDKTGTSVTHGAQTAGSPPTRPPRKRRHKKSKRLSLRADEHILELVDARMAEAGVNESEAIRQLIEDSARSTRIIINAKASVEMLETFLGKLQVWQHDFQSVRSRLNAPLPANPSDTELTANVRKWRDTSNRLHDEIGGLLETSKSVLSQLTSLTPERIKLLQLKYPSITTWRNERAVKMANAEYKKDKELQRTMISTYDAVLGIIEDLGIVPRKR